MTITFDDDKVRRFAHKFGEFSPSIKIDNKILLNIHSSSLDTVLTLLLSTKRGNEKKNFPIIILGSNCQLYALIWSFFVLFIK
jgi:hypothetical protein